MLKLFDVEPKTIRFRPKTQPNSTAKGYLREPLDRAISRIQPEAEDSGRNPVTPNGETSTKRAADLRVLPSPSPCGGCKDMHRGIADIVKANPGVSDEELAVKSGCSTVIVRQAKARYFDWKKEGE